MILSTFAYVNVIPVPLDLLVTITPIYNIAFYLVIIFMTINEFLIGQIIGTWWEALLNWIIISILPALLVYYLPFHVHFFFKFRVNMAMLLMEVQYLHCGGLLLSLL